jgi:glycosyltransferase involved in cell wall biosynthesis
MSDGRPWSVCLVALIAGGHSGVPRYAATLARALDRASGDYPQLALSILATAKGAEAVDPQRIDVRIVARRSSRVNAGAARLVLEHTLVRRERYDLLHYFDASGPILARSRRFVTTIHDAGFVHGFRRVHNYYKRLLYPWTLTQASAVVAVSQFAKEEAVRHFGADPAKVTVVHSGPGFVPEVTADPPASDDGRPYLLFVGNFGGNKNLPFLVRAFHRANLPGRLILAGRPYGNLSPLAAAIAAGSAADRIEILDDVGDDALDRLYRSATALVLPSTYEGFGFTPLEAMARGCPVLMSDLPALREVSGAGAMLLQVGAEDAWVDAMKRISESEDLRAELRARGEATASRYSWDKTARRVLDVLAQTCADRPTPTLRYRRRRPVR